MFGFHQNKASRELENEAQLLEDARFARSKTRAAALLDWTQVAHARLVVLVLFMLPMVSDFHRPEPAVPKYLVLATPAIT